MSEVRIGEYRMSRSNTVHIPIKALKMLGREPYEGGLVEIFVRPDSKEIVIRFKNSRPAGEFSKAV